MEQNTLVGGGGKRREEEEKGLIKADLLFLRGFSIYTKYIKNNKKNHIKLSSEDSEMGSEGRDLENDGFATVACLRRPGV